MQLSLPEHRLQELRARSTRHTSWIFIPAIISLRFLGSQVHRRQKWPEGEALSNASSCLQLILKETEIWVALAIPYIYTYAGGWCHESIQGLSFQDVPSLPSSPSLPSPSSPFPLSPSHFWTSTEGDVFPNYSYYSRFLTQKESFKSNSIENIVEKNFQYNSFPISFHSLTLRIVILIL